MLFRRNKEIFVCILFDKMLQTGQEIVGFLHAQAKRGKQTDDVRAADSGKYLLFEQQLLAEFLDRLFKFQSNHQAASTYFLDAFEVFQFFQQVGTDFGCIFN